VYGRRRTNIFSLFPPLIASNARQTNIPQRQNRPHGAGEFAFSLVVDGQELHSDEPVAQIEEQTKFNRPEARISDRDLAL
jgi:hypothetical protein